jgi:hypothetical protein
MIHDDMLAGTNLQPLMGPDWEHLAIQEYPKIP